MMPRRRGISEGAYPLVLDAQDASRDARVVLVVVAPEQVARAELLDQLTHYTSRHLFRKFHKIRSLR